jgi:pectin methylesterase-like acyl-CoA thioesterase
VKIRLLIVATVAPLWCQSVVRPGESIQRAIDQAKEGSTISISPGEYREVVTVNKAHVTLRGTGKQPSQVVVIFNKSAADSGSTFNSATANIRGDDFHAENLTIANDYNRTHIQQSQGSQAVAVSVTGDRAVFRNVRLLGNQDTVYLGTKDCNPGAGEQCMVTRQYFSKCYIEGNVDFIFGDGKAVFEDCEIHSTEHKGGYITAQGKHYAAQDSGFVFRDCKLTGEIGVSGVWLGRPWRPFATVVFIDTKMGPHIDPAGWREWHPGETNYLETVYYGEYRSTGRGASSKRDAHTHLLTREEAARFETRTFLGWEPDAK